MSDRTALAPAITTLRTRVLYGFGSAAQGAGLQVMGGLLLLFYNQVVGLGAQWVSLALAISLLVDSFWDPIVGFFSDNLRTRWGRRHPLMLLSVVPIAVSFTLLFSPPHGLSQFHLFLYLLGTVMATRLSFSLYDVPSGALAPELAPDYVDRTTLLGFRWMLGTLGGAVAAYLAYGMFLKATPAYPLGQLNPAGYPRLAISAAAVMAVSILVSTFGTLRNVAGLYRPPKRRIDLGETVRELAQTMNNWNFGVALVAGVISAVATSLTAGLAVYYGTYFWKLPAASILLIVLTGLIAAPIATWVAPTLTRRWGKKRACMTLFFLSVISANFAIVLRLLGLFPLAGFFPIAVLIGNGVVGSVLGTSGFIIVTSMIADIVEESQLKTGRRSEGLLFSADALIGKVVSSLATVLPGLLLAYVRFPANADPRTIDPAIMVHLSLIYLPVTIGLTLVSIWCWRFYRLDAAGHSRNLAALGAGLAVPVEAASGLAPEPPGTPLAPIIARGHVG